jgi:NADH-quinone oxidoreductase subunit C
VAEEVAAPEAAEGEVEETATPVEEAPRRHGVPVTQGCDMEVLHPSRDELVELVRTLRAEDGFAMCLDVCGVDYLTYEPGRDLPEGIEPGRFEVVVTLISHERRERLRLRVQVPADDPTCPSLFDCHPGAEAMEREVYDLFGIEFTGHPDLTRILMPEDWDGHPLRKDAAIGRIPVQFKAPGEE